MALNKILQTKKCIIHSSFVCRYCVVFFVLQLSCLSLSANELDVTELVETVTETFLDPLTSPQQAGDLFVINIHQDLDPDYSSETEYVYDSTETSTDSETTNSDTTVTETNEILEMTANYHNMRVKNDILTHANRKQHDIITQMSKKIRDLEIVLKKRKASSDKKLNEIIEKNEKCRIDYNSVSSDLQIAKKLISMEKYSRLLKRKLGEFGVLSM
jgi:predicted nucleotidyltransferase